MQKTFVSDTKTELEKVMTLARSRMLTNYDARAKPRLRTTSQLYYENIYVLKLSNKRTDGVGQRSMVKDGGSEDTDDSAERLAVINATVQSKGDSEKSFFKFSNLFKFYLVLFLNYFKISQAKMERDVWSWI